MTEKVIIKQTLFSQPKNTKLIKYLNILLRDKNSLVLDFFAGSGTTAHAVMALNAEDQGNRKFITVQIDKKQIKRVKPTKQDMRAFLTLPKHG